MEIKKYRGEVTRTSYIYLHSVHPAAVVGKYMKKFEQEDRNRFSGASRHAMLRYFFWLAPWYFFAGVAGLFFHGETSNIRGQHANVRVSRQSGVWRNGKETSENRGVVPGEGTVEKWEDLNSKSVTQQQHSSSSEYRKRQLVKVEASAVSAAATAAAPAAAAAGRRSTAGA